MKYAQILHDWVLNMKKRWYRLQEKCCENYMARMCENSETKIFLRV